MRFETETTASPKHGTPSFSLSVDKARRNTDSSMQRIERNSLSLNPSQHTDEYQRKVGASILNKAYGSFSVKKPTQAVERANFIEGSVYCHDDVSVTCHFYVDGEKVTAELSRALFPDDVPIHHGMPFTLSMTNDDYGLRSPVVNLLPVPPMPTDEAAAWDRLFASLDE